MTILNLRRCAVALAVSIGLAAPNIAAAEGTAAGTSVSNTFTVDYQVGGVAQPQVTPAAPAVFVVDRLVDLTVSTITPTVSVSPGATNQQFIYSVENTGNGTQAYALEVADAGSDDFDIAFTNFSTQYFNDVGVIGTYEPGIDTLVSAYTLNSGAATVDLVADERIWVVVTTNIPNTVTNGQTDGVVFTARTLNAGTTTETVATATADDPNAEDTVLGDGAGATDAANDGDHSVASTFVVTAAAFTASKTVSVVATAGELPAFDCASDPTVAGNQYSVPGACVEYVISLSNAAGAATATNINIADTIPDEVELVGVTQASFTTPGTIAPAALPCAAPCTVSLTNAELAAATTGTITIRAIVR